MSILYKFIILSNPFPHIPNYLIQRINDKKFNIHRELLHGELRYYKSEEILELKKRLFVREIAIATNMQEAEALIRTYWGKVPGMIKAVF